MPRGGRLIRGKPQAKVQFRPKQAWQKADCINQSAEYQCPNESTLETFVGSSEGKITSLIRCCTDEKCKAVAAAIALRTMQ